MCAHNRPLVLMWHTTAIVPRFLAGLRARSLYLAYDNEVPDFDACYWMSGRYAARLNLAQIDVHLTAPGAQWLTTVDESLLGRPIRVCTLNNLPEGIVAHIKPAQLKIDELPAKVYFSDHYLEIAKETGAHPETLVQWTDIILDLNHEHRFYVLDGQIVAGSPYLVDGHVYTVGMTSPMSANAFAFAQEALSQLGENTPAAFTLDVGFDQNSGKWVIVEANPAWSSGMYGANMEAVIATIDRSCDFDSQWTWTPDADLLRQAKQISAMHATDVNLSTTIIQINTPSPRSTNV